MKLGIIGGSGLGQLPGLENAVEQNIDTPFGKPSAPILDATLGDAELFFLARHGKGHSIMPSEVNFKANIAALKMLGATHILSISAVGSLREEIRPRDVVIPDQYFDRTKRPGSDHTFFGGGVVGHIAFGHPVCPELSHLAAQAAEEAIRESDASERKVFRSGTYVNMEGPAFSTKAESEFYRSTGAAVIGMTNLAEAKLAREAEICYATVAMVTDYDCWHPDHDHVTVEMVVGHFHANIKLAQEIIRLVTRRAQAGLSRKCACPHALAGAILTDPAVIPAETKRKLQPIMGKYFK